MNRIFMQELLAEAVTSGIGCFCIGALAGAVAAVFAIVLMNEANVAFQLKALSCHESVSTGVNSYICYVEN